MRVVVVISEADPAELVLAARACHVHASLVLLDGLLALWAWLCVQLHPCLGVAIFVADTLQPCLQQLTVDWQMGILTALEAP